MMANRDLAFPMVMVCLVFINGYSPLPTTPLGFSTEAFEFPFEDYSQYDETVTPITHNSVSPYGGMPKRCNYNPCLEIPCAELAALSGCLCPGLTLHDVVPEAPRLRSVSWNGSEVVIQWCAPHSYVTAYVVTVGGEERQMFGKDQRSAVVGDMDHITEVCVAALNDAGYSKPSCLMYQPRDSSLPLKAGLIGGALGFLLLLLLAVLLWRHNRQRKQEADITMHDTAETQ